MEVVRPLELFLSSTAESEEGTLDDKKVIWKDILREGTFAMTPGLGGAKRKPFTIVADGETDWDNRSISMSDLENSVKEKAFEHVTIPVRHEDNLLDNTGFVQGTRRVQKEIDGKPCTVLQGALGFTEPDIGGKVSRGTIPNVSSGILGNFTRKADGKKFRAALKHVALTHVPFINKLEPFKAVFASDEEIEGDEIEIEGYQFAETDNSTADNSAEILWDERKGFNWKRSEIETALAPDSSPDVETPVSRPSYFVSDVSEENIALVEEFFRGDRKRWLIPFDVGESTVEIAPATRWVEVREAMVAASDEDFQTVTFSALKENLNSTLSDIAPECEVEEITLDQRVRIKGDSGSEWIAHFAYGVDGAEIDPPAEWTRTKEPEKIAKPEQSVSQPRKVHLSDVSANTPEGRLEAARVKRRKKLAS